MHLIIPILCIAEILIMESGRNGSLLEVGKEFCLGLEVYNKRKPRFLFLLLSAAFERSKVQVLNRRFFPIVRLFVLLKISNDLFDFVEIR